jgi:hypothetical protein
MEGSMAERITGLGLADPLGHFYLPEDHGDNHTDRHGVEPEHPGWDEHDADGCPRSAKSIVLSSRTHLLVRL